MSGELIRDVHICRHQWEIALDAEFDADKLMEIKDRYDRAMRCNAVYSALCNEQRQSWLKDLELVRTYMRTELEPLSKNEIAIKYGYPDGAPKGMTKANLIDSYLFTNASLNIEPEHTRVKRIWESMTPNEREYGRYEEPA